MGPLIHEEISEVLVKRLDDPGLARLTITRVKMTPDLKIARVYFSVIGGDEVIEAASKALDRARGVFKRAISQNLSLRYLPELEFFYDRNIAHADRIEQILHEINSREGAPEDES